MRHNQGVSRIHSATLHPNNPDGTPLKPGETHTCRMCGYALAGLGADGNCPECLTPVARSLRGNMLEYADPHYLKRLRLGVAIVFFGTIADILWFVSLPVLFNLTTGTNPAISIATASFGTLFIDFAGAIITLVGWWMLTAPDPSLQDIAADIRARRALRALLIFIAFGSITSIIVYSVPVLAKSPFAAVAGTLQFNSNTVWSQGLLTALALRVLLLLAKVARFFVSIIYLRAIAERIPSLRLRTFSGRLLWLVPLLATVGIALFAMGPVIAVGLYIALLWMFWKELGAVIRRNALATAEARQ